MGYLCVKYLLIFAGEIVYFVTNKKKTKKIENKNKIDLSRN